MDTPQEEKNLLRSVALQNAREVMRERDRAEAELVQANKLLEQKTKELALEREWLHVTLSSIGDAVIATDAAGIVTFLNPVAETITGWQLSEAIGQPLEAVFNIINEQTRETVLNPVRRALNEGIIVGLANHTSLISKDGKETAIEDSAAPTRDASGKVSGAVMVFHDVTERRKAEMMLRQTHDQFFALVNHSPTRVFLVDSNLIIRQINARAQLAFGNLKDLVGWKLSDLIEMLWSPEVAAKIVGHFRETLETGKPFLEYGFSETRTDRQSQEYYDWEIHRITLPDGQKGVACYFIDISAHVLAQQALQSSENRKSAILSASLDAIITMDHHGKIVDFNPAAEKIFGHTREAASNKPLAELIVPERFRKKHYEGLARYLASGEGPVLNQRLELPALRATGEEFPTELSISRIPGSNPAMFTATLRDITDRKKAENALLERAQLAAFRAEVSTALATTEDFQRILQTCAQAMVTHLEGSFARIWTVNEAEQVLEMQASAGLYTHLNGPHGRVKIGEYKIGRIAKSHEPLLTNDVVHDKNISDPDWAKKEGMVAFVGCPLLLEGKVMGVIAMFAKHLLTENVLKELIPIAEGLAQWVKRKRTEEALAKAQRELQSHAATLEVMVQERTAALSEKIGELEAFSYSISHDMRSPLRAMQGYAAALLADYKDKLDDEAQQYLQRIHRASTRLDLLIRDVLTYNRLSKQDLILRPIDLQRLISEICETNPAFQPPQLLLTIQHPLPMMLGNEAFLNQIISNLLGNAAKFMKPGVAPSVTVRAEEMGPDIRIWFEDNGIGIDPSHFTRIFEIFGRVYGDKKFEGTGIGLAIVKKTVERMGGTVGVESELGAGSRFWFNLKKA